MLIDLKVWRDHFEYHSTHLRPLPDGKRQTLTETERGRIADSIAIFQLGEQSEGRTLLQTARRYAAAHDVPAVARIVELLIAEEHHHAALLGAFMDQHGLRRKHRDWTDLVFRMVRRLAGMELHLSVLITAELIGKVYYRALEAATECLQLKALCSLLIADELAHVGFESDLLHGMRARRWAGSRFGIRMAHRGFLAGAALVVWFTHRPVLRAAGYRLPVFLRVCDAQFSFYLGSAAALAARFNPVN